VRHDAAAAISGSGSTPVSRCDRRTRDVRGRLRIEVRDDIANLLEREQRGDVELDAWLASDLISL